MLWTSFLLVAAIFAIILLSARYKFNVFFVLIAVAALTGLLAGFAPEKVIATMKTGLGSTIEKIGLLIVLGITLGSLLEKSGATTSLANDIIRRAGIGNTPMAMTVMGYVIGFPVFCDSGFVVLSGLMLSLSVQAPGKHLWLVTALASALYAVHCLAPPHPGITSAAGNLQADIGLAMLMGGVVAVPTALVGYFLGKKMNSLYPVDYQIDTNEVSAQILPSPWLSLIPVVLPVMLIGTKSVIVLNKNLPETWWTTALKTAGDPVVALLVGVLCCIPLLRSFGRSNWNHLLDDALSKAGNILLITAAGGAFGEVIKAMDIGAVFGPALAQSGWGLLVPFLLAAVFKTAQGSSTVAVMAATAIIAPLMSAMGFDSDMGRTCALLAAGAGSMVVSHSNDSYFWVISKFGAVNTATMLRSFTVMTGVMGCVAFSVIWLMYLIFNEL